MGLILISLSGGFERGAALREKIFNYSNQKLVSWLNADDYGGN